ncbi:hypothetical protein BC936DRAFT_143369 [Jimgerdemannia flammicorona]|uniref:Uncharacterized protein n=1 Tax=Jimgerdemannia flammicorona TaxID=994334 RepID=A0A433DE13_9FUNG|nr:hypothetical protein BC936DRAFT_143369 [Jimgerdemannia flammicorona]
MTEVLKVINVLITVGVEIKKRLDDQGDAIEELDQLVFNLEQLDRVFTETKNVRLKEIYAVKVCSTLEGVKKACESCAKYVEVKSKSRAIGIIKKGFNLYKAPAIKEDIQRNAKRVSELLATINFVLMSDVERKVSDLQISSAHNSVVSSAIVEVSATYSDSASVLTSELRGAIANTVDDLVSRLKGDCQRLQDKLDQATLVVDSSLLQSLEGENPEGISFLRDRFHPPELVMSSVVPFENVYVSWARFVHEIEISFEIKKLPTAYRANSDVDTGRLNGGSYYDIDPNGTQLLSAIRPLWIPALRNALDPLHKGYVKPDDYLSFLGGDSLTSTLRRVVLESAGYGIIVECQRSTGDFSLPDAIEDPHDHVGWMSACEIVTVPLPEDLGIIGDNVSLDANSSNLIKYFTDTKQDISVYVRYLQTGQIQIKNLSTQIRPFRGLRIGASLSVRYKLEDQSNAWSQNLPIVEFKARAGGRYIVTAGIGENALVFSTAPLTQFVDRMVNIEQPADATEVLELEFTLLGSTTVFNREPKIGEKIQVQDPQTNYWYDVKVTAVNGDKVEYEQWSAVVEDDVNEDYGDDDDSGMMGFGDEELLGMRKGTSKLWCPWVNDITNCDVRPYRCLDIGDVVEVPVLYPDYAFTYHSVQDSQLYLPARIVDVEEDIYLVEFSPRVMAYKWWPGRASVSSKVPRTKGATETVENPFSRNRLKVNMDLVRPSAVASGAHPVLGTVSLKPQSWSAFQGIQMTVLQDVVEKSFWHNKRL